MALVSSRSTRRTLAGLAARAGTTASTASLGKVAIARLIEAITGELVSRASVAASSAAVSVGPEAVVLAPPALPLGAAWPPLLLEGVEPEAPPPEETEDVAGGVGVAMVPALAGDDSNLIVNVLLATAALAAL